MDFASHVKMQVKSIILFNGILLSCSEFFNELHCTRWNGLIIDWGGEYNTDIISLTGCRAPAHLILLLAVTIFCLVFYILRYHPSGIGLVVVVSTSPTTTSSPNLSPSTSLLSHNITYPSTPDTKQEPSHTYKPKHSDDSLVALLASLKFKNYGIVKSTDNFIMQDIPCGYSSHYYYFFLITFKYHNPKLIISLVPRPYP